MIYLLATGDIESSPLLKIGYTLNINRRFIQYRSHNPKSILLKTREGDEIIESYLQDYFSDYKYPELEEWFYYNEEIVNNFDIEISDEDIIRRAIKSLTGLSFTESFKRYCLFMNQTSLINKDNNKETEEYRELYQKFSLGQLSLLGYNKDKILEVGDCEIPEVKEFLLVFYSLKSFSKKLKMYCEFRDKYKDNKDITLLLSLKIKDYRYSSYYQYFGTSRCSTYSFSDSILRDHFTPDLSENLLRAEILSIFKEGESYPNKYIKETLSDIYKKLSIIRTPKARDLSEYFNLTKSKVRVGDERVDGLKLLPKL